MSRMSWMNEQTIWTAHGDLVGAVHRHAHRTVFFPPFFLSIHFISFLFDEWPVYHMLVFSVVHLTHMYMLNECCIVAASVQRKISTKRKIYLYIHTRVHISNAYMYTSRKKYGRWEDTHTIMWWKRASNLCQEAAESSRPFHNIIIIVLSKCAQCAHVIYLIASTVAVAAAAAVLPLLLFIIHFFHLLSLLQLQMHC